jgi:transcriptional regulator with XRE-family HTH domain
MKLNDFLRHYREGMGLSQLELAEKMQVSRYKLRKWETGEGKPKSIDLENIRKYFNLKSLVEISNETLQSALGGEKTNPLPAKELQPISLFKINDEATVYKLLEEKDRRISDLQKTLAMMEKVLDLKVMQMESLPL